MTSEEIFQKVKKGIVDVLRVEEDAVTLETDLIQDLGADSLDLVELIMVLEDIFNLEVSEEEVANITKVKEIIDFIAKNLP